VGADLFHVEDRRKYRRDEANSRFSQFCERAKKEVKRVEVKCVPQRATKARKGNRSVALILLQPRHAPAALRTGKSHYALHRRQFGSQGRSGHIQKISPPPGFETRPVWPVASHYTDRTNLAHAYVYKCVINLGGITSCIIKIMNHVKYVRGFTVNVAGCVI
jgi:hypothetical protein